VGFQKYFIYISYTIFSFIIYFWNLHLPSTCNVSKTGVLFRISSSYGGCFGQVEDIWNSEKRSTVFEKVYLWSFLSPVVLWYPMWYTWYHNRAPNDSPYFIPPLNSPPILGETLNQTQYPRKRGEGGPVFSVILIKFRGIE
jgi:hypothetical protein